MARRPPVGECACSGTERRGRGCRGLVVVHSSRWASIQSAYSLQELAEFLRAVSAADVRSADERGDDHGERRGRVAGVLLPALLLRDRSVAHKERRGSRDEGDDVEVAEAVELPEPPGEDDREGDLVELNAGPVGRSVDPEVLSKASVRMLRASEVNERAAGGVDASAG